MKANNKETRYIEACPLGCAAEVMNTDISLPEGCLQACSACGQLFSQCTQSFFNASMQEFNDPKGTWPPAANLPRLARSTSRLLKRVESLLGKKRGEMRLLDVGCSSGAFISMAGQLGMNCEGVEPAAEAVAAAGQKGLKVYQGFLGDLHLPAASYDVITLFEVIEHVKEPLPLLLECQRLLRKGGLLVIRTGNTASWTVKILKGSWEYFSISKHGGHISFFNKHAMALLARRTGFEVRKFYTHSVSLTDKDAVSAFRHRLWKILAEALNMPARLYGRGQEMEVFLGKV